MEKLHNFYTNWLRITAVIIGMASVYIVSNTPPSFHKIVVSGLTIGVLFLGMEWVVREKLWRLSIFHRRIDYEDTWKCVTFYEAVETEDTEFKNSFKTYHKTHEAKIEQDAKTISIQSSSGKAYNYWKSLLMNFDDDEISYAYSVDYSSNDIELEGSATGFEKLSVRQRFPNSKSGKPILLCGTFAHCAEGQPHIFRGTAVFCSSKHLADIMVKKDMSDFQIKGIEVLKS